MKYEHSDMDVVATEDDMALLPLLFCAIGLSIFKSIAAFDECDERDAATNQNLLYQS